MTQRWMVVGRPGRITHGGSLRARYLFETLVARTRACSIYRPDHEAIRELIRHPSALLPGTNVAAAELLPNVTLPAVRRLYHLRVLDIHDHPVLHPSALGFPLTASAAQEQERLLRANLEAFRKIVVVSETLGELAGIPRSRRLVLGNGTDPRLIRPGPWPTVPSVGIVSVAARGRGIETLVEAVRLVRRDVPDISLRLCLSAYDEASRDYLAALQSALPTWTTVTSVPYRELETFLATTTVLVVPHPPGASWDAAPTVKLFDYLAAGRPVVVTPRLEMARVVRAEGVGVVADGDAAEDLASAIAAVLADEAAAIRMGALARTAAVERYDWRILSSQLADEVLAA